MGSAAGGGREAGVVETLHEVGNVGVGEVGKVVGGVDEDGEAGGILVEGFEAGDLGISLGG